MKQRIITAIVVIAIVLGVLSIGEKGLVTLIIGVLAVAAYELYSLIKNQVKPIIYPLMLAVMVIASFVSISKLFAIICGYLLVLSVLTIVTEWFKLEMMGLIFLMTILVVIAIYSALNIFFNFGYLAFMWILLSNYMTDTMAYFVGVGYGRNKMIPSISPNKTWEGAAGGYFGGLLSSLVFGYFLLGNVFPLEFIVLAAMLIPLVAQIGDLFFSSIKRHYGVKDFGTLLPSHGGILDRVDSLVFTLVLMMLLLNAWGVFSG